jgi:hypothetical protein
LNLPKEEGRSGEGTMGSDAKEPKSTQAQDFLPLASSLPRRSRSLAAEKNDECERGKEEDRASKGKDKPSSTQKEAHLAVWYMWAKKSAKIPAAKSGWSGFRRDRNEAGPWPNTRTEVAMSKPRTEADSMS